MKLKVFSYVSVLPEMKNNDVAIFRQPSPLDEFSVEVLNNGKKDIVFVSNEISLLFNQQRLMALNPLVLQQYFQPIRQAAGEQLPDDVLLDGLKSRYIQSNADMYNYTRWLNNHIEEVAQDIKEKYQMQQAAQQNGAAPSVQPSGENQQGE